MHTSIVPEKLLRSLEKVNGFEEHDFVEAHENPQQIVSVRFNPYKLTGDAGSIFPGSTRVPWSSMGYYLPSRPQFVFDPLLHAGVYYVQEASGMFLEQCIKQTVDLNAKLNVLDLCAAPGGKSTLIQSLISPSSLLISNEVIKTRVSVLKENIIKWGPANVVVTNNDPRDFARLENFFDVMVVDAPCSGSGLFRRDPSAVEEWSIEAVSTCSLRQQRILQDAYPCLKEQGMLIYSTCSYSPEENEQVCDWLMTKYAVESVPIKIEDSWHIIESRSEKGAYGYRFFPDKLKGEGFYVACFRKKDGGSSITEKPKKQRSATINSRDRKIVTPWLKDNNGLAFYAAGDDVFCVPAENEDEIQTVLSNLYIKKAGVNIGKVIRDELLPAHDLALSLVKRDELPSVSLKKAQALQYLRKEEVTIDGEATGWTLAVYEGYALGWMKILKNRVNNYYPKEWRILKSGSFE